MSMAQQVCVASAFAIALVAAISDCQRGTIPNWLTLPVLAGLPIVFGATLGVGVAVQCVAAAFLSGAIPFVLFRYGAMGGGDVKLIAALGAVMVRDPLFGLRVQVVAFAIGMLVALGSLAKQGSLWSSTRSALAVSLNPLLPPRFRLRASEPSRCSVRLGVPVLLATALALAPHLALLRGRL